LSAILPELSGFGVIGGSQVFDQNGNGIVNAGEVLHQSANTGLLAEQLKVSTLLPGNYFVVVELGANTAANYTIELGATKSTVADILWRDFSKNQVGYWRFDGLNYMDTRTVTSAMDAGWRFEAIGDFDGDRAEDILWRHSSTNELVVWLLDPETATIKTGSGYIKQTATQNYMIPDSFRVVGVGDTNGDGKGDIIWRNESAQTTVVWYMNGSQFVDGGAVRLAGQTGPLLNDASWELVDTTRINDDAKFDIVWRNRTSNQVVNWIMDGNVITTGGTTSQRLGAAYDIESVGDFNGDGRGDLLWRDTQGNVQMWLVNAQYNNYDIQTLKLSNGTAVPTVGTEFKLVGVEDFSGDGKSDIVWRHQTSGALVLWNMDGATITQQSASVSNADITNLNRQTLGTASKADFVDFGVQLSAAADSGISQSDWITNVRRSELSGVAAAGSQVSLFANNALIGTTTATTAGTWSIVGNALDDGVYSLSTRITSQTGFVMNQTIGRKLTIDGTAPELTTTGLVDGVAWNPSDQLNAILRDIDPKARVEYSITGGQLQVSAVLDATLEIDGTAKTGTVGLNSLSGMGFVAQTDGSLSKRTEIALKVTDRAGNVQTQTLKGMVLNLSDLTDDSYVQGRSTPGYTSGGTADTKTPPTGTWVPQATVGTTLNQALYIGPGGAWGYAQAGTGTAAGGNGIAVGTIGWVAASQYNPTTGTGGTTTPPLPPSPTLPTNIPALLDYVPALEVIFKTAIDVLSNHGATAAKKSVLQSAYNQLLSTGRLMQGTVAEDVALRQAMQPLLNGVYDKAYGPGGKLAKGTAVQLGWELAKGLASSSVSTRLQTFEAPLLAAVHGAVKANGGTIAPTAQGSLLTTVKSLARSYAQLNPSRENGNSDGDVGEDGQVMRGFLDRIWNGTDFEDGRPTVASPIATDTISYLKANLVGQTDVGKALQFVDRMIQSATRVETLHQGVNGYTTGHTYIQYGGFLRELTELGFEIARVNPTTTVGVNTASEWIETLWEGGNLTSASEGLSDWFGSHTLNQSGSLSGMYQLSQSMNYSRSLVQLAQLANIDQIAGTEPGDFLSYLVNLGGIYAGLNPTKSTPTELGSFLQTLWQNPNSVLAQAKAAQELLTDLGGTRRSIKEKNQILKYRYNQLATLSQVNELRGILRDPEFLTAVNIAGYAHQNQIERAFVADTVNSFFGNTWKSESIRQLRNTSGRLRSVVTNPENQLTAIDRDTALQIALGITVVIPRPKTPSQIAQEKAEAKARLELYKNLYPNVGPPAPLHIPNPDVLNWLPIDKTRPKVVSVGKKIGNKKALVLAPHAYEFEPLKPYNMDQFSSYGGDEANEIAQVLADAGFEVTMRRNGTFEEDNIDLKRDLLENDLGQYGVIAITSHGSVTSYGSGVDNQVVVSTGKRTTVSRILQYGGYVVSGELDFWGNSDEVTFAITPELIRKHMSPGNNTFVYVGSCESLENDSLANAFLDAGASSFVGYTKVVESMFAAPHGLAMFNKLVTGRATDQISGLGDIDTYYKNAIFERRGISVSIV
jgi:Bacterial Ig-like domain